MRKCNHTEERGCQCGVMRKKMTSFPWTLTSGRTSLNTSQKVEERLRMFGMSARTLSTFYSRSMESIPSQCGAPYPPLCHHLIFRTETYFVHSLWREQRKNFIEEGDPFPYCTHDNKLWTLTMSEDQCLRSFDVPCLKRDLKRKAVRTKDYCLHRRIADWLHQIIYNLLKHWYWVERGLLGPGQNSQQSLVAR